MKEINIKLETKDDNFDTCTFLNLFISYIASNTAKHFQCNYMGYEEKVKHTLTEDERVILRNIKNNDFGKYIGRGDTSRENTPVYYNLYLRGDDESKAYAIGTIYNHLFKFIKERRRI